MSGAPAPAATHAPTKSFLDAAAFPCVAWADVVSGVVPPPPEDPAETAMSLSMSLQHLTLVGSAPTNILMKNGVPLADYALNPRRRRGGQECDPDVASSLSLRDSAGGAPTVGSMSGSVQTNYLSQAVIGSLPRGMSTEDRMKMLMALPMSPSRAMLQQLSAEVVASRTETGRQLRRKVLKGAVMVFVTAGYSGKRFIFEKAKELGVRSVVIDGPDSWVQLLEKEGTIEAFLPIDFSNAETVFDRCCEAIRRVGSQLGGIDGVTTFCEMAVPLASRLAEKLGLPCNTPCSVDNARDKHATRDIMMKAGLPTPRHYRVATPDDVAKAAAHVGFPAVIKPVNGAASIGVIRVNDEAALQKAYTRVVSDMARCRVVAGALVEGDESQPESEANAGSWIQLVLMVEEYLDGQEVDCDLIFDGGRPVYGAVTDNWPTVEPYFNETGSNCPSVLPRASQAELLELSVRAVQSLGLVLGVFHVECKQTSRGPRLIEVNTRMGGGPVRDTNLLVWGVDLVEEHLMASAGVPVRPVVSKRPLINMAEYTLNAPKSGHIAHLRFLDRYEGRPDVLYARPLIAAGARTICVDDGLPTWVCELMVKRGDVRDAIAYVQQIEQEITADLQQLIA